MRGLCERLRLEKAARRIRALPPSRRRAQSSARTSSSRRTSSVRGAERRRKLRASPTATVFVGPSGKNLRGSLARRRAKIIPRASTTCRSRSSIYFVAHGRTCTRILIDPEASENEAEYPRAIRWNIFVHPPAHMLSHRAMHLSHARRARARADADDILTPFMRRAPTELCRKRRKISRRLSRGERRGDAREGEDGRSVTKHSRDSELALQRRQSAGRPTPSVITHE